MTRIRPGQERLASLAAALLASLVVAGCGSTAKEGNATATAPQAGDTTTAAPEPTETAEAVVAESGFTQSKESVSWGAVIENPAADAEVRDVAVSVNALDSAGNVLGTDDATIAVIPGGGSFNLAGESLSIAAGDKVKSLDVAVTTESSGPNEHPLPEVSNVRISRDPDFGPTIHAQIRNTLEEPLSSFARASAVLRNSNGKIIGGLFTYPKSEIPPGQKRAIEFSAFGIEGLDSVAKADMSVDNEAAP